MRRKLKLLKNTEWNLSPYDHKLNNLCINMYNTLNYEFIIKISILLYIIIIIILMLPLLYDIIITSIVVDTLNIIDSANDTIEASRAAQAKATNNFINTVCASSQIENTANKFSMHKLLGDLFNPRCIEVKELTNTFYMNNIRDSGMPSLLTQRICPGINYNCDSTLACALNKGKVLFFIDCFNNAIDQLKITAA